MKTLSLCMIVKNEEENLENCLKNANKYADEIIIADTGSTDKTKEIALKYTENVFDFEWCNDFAKARNFAFDKATSEYIIWLDADDIVLEDSVEKIVEWKNGDDDSDVLMCRYVTAFDENFKPTFQFNRERIVKNSPLFRWNDPVHEVIIPSGKITYSDEISVYHNKKAEAYTDRNLNIYLKMIADGITFSPRQQFYYARELYYNNKIDEALHEFSKFISSKKGWVENNIEACLNMSKCYQIKKEYENALSSLFASFIFALPRAEILFEIASIFKIKNKLDMAIYWYKQALNLKPDISTGAFINEDCYTFLPALELCVCYYKKGEIEKSYHYHEIAKAFKPDNEIVKGNQKFFDNLNKNIKK